MIGGHTLVPLRSIFDALGAELAWDNSTQTAAGRRGESAIEIQIGSPTAFSTVSLRRWKRLHKS